MKKMHVNIISSLETSTQVGGAALRCKVFDYIYQRLKLSHTHYFQKNRTRFHTLKSLAQTLYYGKNSASLFKKAKLVLDDNGLLHLDNLRHFSWDFSNHPSAKIIFNAHNLEFENYYDRNDTAASKKLSKYELKMIDRAALTCLCSEREKKIVEELNPKLADKTIVIPNLIEKENYHSDPIKNVISFIGALNYWPNILAIDYLCNDFAKTVPKEIFQQYRFVIAGRLPSPEMHDLIKDSPFELMDSPSNDEIRNLFSKSKLLLVPLTAGSGTRIKIAEAIFSGANVLSTPLGREGLNSSYISEESIDQFAQKFLSLIKQDQFQSDIDEEFYRNNDLTMWVDQHLELLKSRIIELL